MNTSKPYLAKILTPILLFVSVQAHADNPSRELASRALALRQSALDGDQQFSDVTSRMPGSGIVDSEVLSRLWSLSFPNMIVKLGRHRSEAPVSLYYDPLLDIAVLAFWECDDGCHVKAVRALPGEWLGPGIQDPPVLPSWMSEEAALSALVRTTGERLDAFAGMHPGDAMAGGLNDATFAEAAAGMRAVLPRLLWNANQRVQWSGSYQWLSPLLEEVEQALHSGSSDRIAGIAPETDPDTVEALAELPEQYIDELALDMMVRSQSHRLLAASSAADGDVYVMILCEVDGTSCRAERFMLISLVD